MKKQTLIIVDDHKIFREGLKNLINTEGIAQVIAEAENGAQFIKMLDIYMPEIVLMDISMPEMNGIEATKKALEKQPKLKILALSSFGDEEYYYKMIEAGVKGFVLKNSGLFELEKAIKDIARGESYFSNELLRRIITNLGKESASPSDNLTKRENEVLQLICQGFTNKEIAAKLNISQDTVKGHRTNLLDKTNCRNTASLVIYAIKNKLVKV